MSIATKSKRSVGTILWKHIQPFKMMLNITENPSVGTLTAPDDVCTLIDFALKTMLQASLDRGCKRVRVFCIVNDQRELSLGVADDAPLNDIIGRATIAISEYATRLPDAMPCLIHPYQEGNETIVQLIIPLSPRPEA